MIYIKTGGKGGGKRKTKGNYYQLSHLGLFNE